MVFVLCKNQTPGVGWRRGKRTLNLWYAKNLRKVVEIPTCYPATHRNAVLVILLLE